MRRHRGQLRPRQVLGAELANLEHAYVLEPTDLQVEWFKDVGLDRADLRLPKPLGREGKPMAHPTDR